MVDKNQNPYVLEADTISGKAETGLVPGSAQLMETSFDVLAEKTVKLALEKQNILKTTAVLSVKRITPDDKIMIALLAPFYSAIINSAIVFMLQIKSTDPGFVLFRNISIVIIGLIFLYALPVVLRRSLVFTNIVLSLFIILLSGTYLLFPGNIPFLYQEGVLLYMISITLPCFIYAYNVRDYDKFYRYMGIFATFVIIICFSILAAMFIFSFGIDNSYSMSLGYSAVLASIYFLHKAFDGKRLMDVLFFGIGFALIISIGSRGPLLCLAFFILAYSLFILMRQKLTLGKFISIFLAIAVLGSVVYAIGNQAWLMKINNVLLDYNINSRTLVFLINENIGHSSSRDSIYSYLLQKVQERPLIGYGIGSDRIMVGMYAHNLFLALFVFFGVIGGLISSLAMVITPIGGFVIANNQKVKQLLIILFSVYFVPTMVSGDVLTNYGLWILLGISLSIVTSRSSFGFRKRETIQADNLNYLSVNSI